MDIHIYVRRKRLLYEGHSQDTQTEIDITFMCFAVAIQVRNKSLNDAGFGKQYSDYII